MREYFTQYGNVVGVKLMMDKFSKKFRGFAFVSMSKEEEAAHIIEQGPHKILASDVSNTFLYKISAKLAFTKEQSRLKLIEETQRKIFIKAVDVLLEEGNSIINTI